MLCHSCEINHDVPSQIPSQTNDALARSLAQSNGVYEDCSLATVASTSSACVATLPSTSVNTYSIFESGSGGGRCGKGDGNMGGRGWVSQQHVYGEVVLKMVCCKNCQEGTLC